MADTERCPAAIAQTATASRLGNEWTRPRGSRGSGTRARACNRDAARRPQRAKLAKRVWEDTRSDSAIQRGRPNPDSRLFGQVTTRTRHASLEQSHQDPLT